MKALEIFSLRFWTRWAISLIDLTNEFIVTSCHDSFKCSCLSLSRASDESKGKLFGKSIFLVNNFPPGPPPDRNCVLIQFSWNVWIRLWQQTIFLSLFSSIPWINYFCVSTEMVPTMESSPSRAEGRKKINVNVSRLHRSKSECWPFSLMLSRLC